MTKEETFAYIKAYLDGDTAVGNIIPLRSVLESAIKYLSEPSLPSDLYEAAEEASQSAYSAPTAAGFAIRSFFKRGFKAGAEWMAGQGETHEAEIIESVPYGGTKWKRCVKVWLDDQFQAKGDKVVVQIRKK